MKKRLASILLTVCMVLAMLPGATITASAAVGDTFTADIIVGGAAVPCTFRVLTEDAGSSTGTVQIGNGTASAIPNTTAGTIIIPSSVSNEGITYTVTKVGNYAFYQCDDLTGTLDIPSSVTSIGNYSFAYCTSFSALRFNSADTLTSIGEGAFYNCSGLAGELDIPDSVTLIGFNAFNGCSGFTGPLIIPNSVTSIGDNAFVNCSGLTGSLTISNAVTSIGYMTFYGCSGLTGGLDIPNSVTSIGDFAFSGCTGFTGALTIPDSVTSIGDRTFENCTGFTGALTIPASVTSIGDYAFFNCRGFTGALTISNSVTSIGSSAFLNCSGFTGALTIPNSVTSIGAYAFYECTGFTGALTIPDSVTFIGNQAFYHCYSISALELQGDTLPATMGDDVFKNCSELNKLIVPATWIGGASVTLPGIASPFTGSKLVKDAGLDSVLGEALSTPAGGAGAAAGTPITWSIDVANDVTQVASTDIVPSTGSTAALYSNADFTANEGASITLTVGGATTAYIKVAGDDTGTVRYHAVTINHVAVVPGAPTSVTATAGDTQASVSFTVPASNGGAAITGYTVTTSPADVPPVNGAGSPIVVNGLTNGRAYTFTVTATNIAGTGAASAASNSITPKALQTITFANPGAQYFGTTPTLSATADSGLTVTFTSSTPAVATITSDGVLTFISTGTATINANQAGNGSYLAAAEVSRSFTVNPVVPGAPTSVTATAGDTQASVSFTAPASNGGAAITGYTVTSSPIGFTATGVSSPITITGLTNGQAYTFTVTATNSVGTGAASTASNSVTPLAPPSSGGGGGSSKTTPTIVTKIETGENVTGTNVDNLVKEGKNLTVEGKAGEKLVFDTEALKTIDNQTKDSVKVEIKDVSADYKNEHPDRLIVSLTITAGGKHIKSFGNGTATVSLPYELKEGEKAADVTVWYLAEDGTMSEVPCSYDPATKLATFKVNHFSLYVVGTADTSKWTNSFRDVKESNWFYDGVRYVSANGLMQGTTKTAFSPNAKITRSMLVTILWRMENQPTVAKTTSFTDVPAGKWYTDAVAWAAANNIAAGYAGKFDPNAPLTREQLASILHRYATYKNYDIGKVGSLTAYADKPSAWALSSVSWAVAEGLLKGSNGNLDPKGSATRAQTASILQRFMENTAK